MILRAALLVSLLSLSGVPAVPRIRHVPGEYPTVQAAIDSAADGDTVLVAPGRYVENIRLRGKNIVVGSEYLVTRDPSVIARTILDGSHPRHPDTASVVLVVDDEDSTAVIEGFTITGGRGTVWLDIHNRNHFREGGGILCEHAAVRIRHNIIEDNEAIAVDSAVVSAGGGGIRCGDGEPLIEQNVVRRNRGLYGGGIVLKFAAATVRNNLVVGNSGGQDFGGSGIWVNNHLSRRLRNIIENNTVVGNRADTVGARRLRSLSGKGGGLLFLEVTATVRNNIIWGNTQQDSAQVASLAAAPSLVYNLVQGGWPGTGNLARAPLFADTVRYYLTGRSPAVDAGLGAPQFNDRAVPRRGKGPGRAASPARGTVRNDLGAYGGPGSEVLLP